MDIETIHTLAADATRAAGNRYTAKRRLLIDTLYRLGEATVPQILEAEPGLAQSSTYRQLIEFFNCGITRYLGRTGIHAVWVLAPTVKRCDCCGQILIGES
jgi:hypothetical protein